MEKRFHSASKKNIGTLSEGYVSITPLQLDLTAYPALHLLRNWQWQQPGEAARVEAAQFSSI